jgi:predicted N-acyltransferase
VFADERRRQDIVPAFTTTALCVARKQRASFIIFDYLSKTNIHNWPKDFSIMADLDPGTRLENCWTSMDEYLASGNKKDRQHYKRVLREAEKLGIKIDRHSCAENVDEALPLIRNVEEIHGALPNPWARPMLEHMQMVNSSFLTARIDNQLVGCGLIFEDNHAQMTSMLGLVKEVPYVYFMLVYESLGMAFERNIRLLRWGSGAYDVKQRLGFSLEDNGSLVFTAVNPFVKRALQWLS